MLTPTPVELLRQVADALAANVLPELPPGPARDELHAGIAILRRIARGLPGYRQFLHDDIADMAATIAAASEGHAERVAAASAPLVERAGALVPAVVPLDELVALDLELRAAVAELAARGHEGTGVAALLVRMTEREAGLRLSPWER